jgi:hypothetical protein
MKDSAAKSATSQIWQTLSPMFEEQRIKAMTKNKLDRQIISKISQKILKD